MPWALKMPLGHLVDLLWRWKDLLVYLGAALIAVLLITWATAGGGAGKIGRLLDKVFDVITDRVS